MFKTQKVMLTHTSGEEMFSAIVMDEVRSQAEVGGKVETFYRVKLDDGKMVVVEPERMAPIH